MHRLVASSLLLCLVTDSSSPALAQSGPPPGQTYVFEGVWAQTPTADGCKIAGTIYDRSFVRSTSDEDDNCRVTNLDAQSANDTYVLKLSCSDAGGDGPTKRFTSQRTLKMTGPNSMVVTDPRSSTLTLQRCVGYKQADSAPPAAAPPPPPAKSQNPGEVGLFCNLTVSGARQDWYISVDLNQGLYTARVNNAVVRQRKAAIMDVTLGNTLTPQPSQLRLQVDFGISMYMAIKPNNQVFLTAPSGGNAMPAGSCKAVAFQGL